MAVNAVARGASLVRGSIALIAMRAALLMLAGLPALAIMGSSIAGGPARRPYFTDVEGRLPGIELLRLFDQLPSLAGPLAGGVAIAVLGEQVLIAGALAWLDPRAARAGGTVGRVLATGFAWLGPMLRVMLCALVLVAAGSWAIDALVTRVRSLGDVAGWSGNTLVLILPLAQGIATLAWTAFVGAWGFWCRVVLVAGDRRQVRTAARTALLLFRRAPWSAPSFFMGITVAAFLASAAVLVVWRQLPPPTVGHVIFLGLLWLATLTAQAWLWHWLVRSALLLHAEPRFADLRELPDSDLGWLRRLVTRR